MNGQSPGTGQNMGQETMQIEGAKQNMLLKPNGFGDTRPEVLDQFSSNSTNAKTEKKSVRSQTGGLIFRRTQPRFEPATWNVNTATLNDEARTNNVCEAWNNGFRCLVGHVNPSLWTVISCFEKDAAMVEAEILRVQRGQPSKKPARKGTVRYQKTLKTLCQQLSNGQKTVEEFLQAIGGHIRLR
ncbi:uncharacterized protein LOC128221675 [Mya arenaria]|uniref:uncharacterized protein LOC128221675 n=1 Tax=Mya arenaria TaxID=6604 RepID=UPI0022E122BE|nr:uncharacterized protein LOC128221675 [Mya arenaria]